MRKIRLFTPGPCQVPEEALLEMARPFEHHRTAWFKQLLRECTDKLRQVLLTRGEVLILTGSGTAAAEAAIVGCNPPGSRMLTIEGGKFGERWGLVGQQFGIDTVRHEIEWGTAVDPQVIDDYLRRDPKIRTVVVVHSETSTATCCDLEAIGRVCRAHDRLLLADCITSAGCLPLRPDDWGVDVVIAGSQKAFMLPPGLAFVALSPRAAEVIRSHAHAPSFYLNLNHAREALAKDDTPWTPAHVLIRGLRVTLDLLLEEGMENVWRRVAAMAAATRSAAGALGLKLYSRSPSDSVTALWVPEGIEEGRLRKLLREQFGVHLAGGQGPLTGRIIRISHMGYVDALDTVGVIAALEHALLQLGAPVRPGDGVAAAQRVLAERLGSAASR